jgi:hypothetical protein
LRHGKRDVGKKLKKKGFKTEDDVEKPKVNPADAGLR